MCGLPTSVPVGCGRIIKKEGVFRDKFYKQQIGVLVAEALSIRGSDVLYIPEAHGDDERTSDSIHALVVEEVVRAISRVEAENESCT